MSIAEFLDGMPSFDENNFSDFNADRAYRKMKNVPVYISTKSTDDQPCDQIIKNDKSHLLIRYLHDQWDAKYGSMKREIEEIVTERASTSNKRPRTD